MATKHENPCLDKVSDVEPIFVLRAQDKLAPGVVEVWANAAALQLGEEHPKVQQARACAEAMRQWPYRKMPD